jgi:DNA-directed RNA polymerase subunit L
MAANDINSILASINKQYGVKIAAPPKEIIPNTHVKWYSFEPSNYSLANARRRIWMGDLNKPFFSTENTMITTDDPKLLKQLPYLIHSLECMDVKYYPPPSDRISKFYKTTVDYTPEISRRLVSMTAETLDKYNKDRKSYHIPIAKLDVKNNSDKEPLVVTSRDLEILEHKKYKFNYEKDIQHPTLLCYLEPGKFLRADIVLCWGKPVTSTSDEQDQSERYSFGPFKYEQVKEGKEQKSREDLKIKFSIGVSTCVADPKFMADLINENLKQRVEKAYKIFKTLDENKFNENNYTSLDQYLNISKESANVWTFTFKHEDEGFVLLLIKYVYEMEPDIKNIHSYEPHYSVGNARIRVTHQHPISLLHKSLQKLLNAVSKF